MCTQFLPEADAEIDYDAPFDLDLNIGNDSATAGSGFPGELISAPACLPRAVYVNWRHSVLSTLANAI
jgi:hypothetical protein